jgi:tRNA pseudouridine38-40 synthase
MIERDIRRNIRLLIAYDGTDFSGWQRQENRRTVQGCIEKALEKLHKRPVALTGSGRTDAGVHAAGQTGNFYTDIPSIAPERFVPALNSLLPHDIRILSANEAALDFHARFDAKSRTYRYHIITGQRVFPGALRYALQVRYRPSLERLNAYARVLRGELDCSTFATPKDPSESRNRYFFNAVFFTRNNTLIFEITANAFLWKMVRSIVGTLLFCEEKCLTPAAFAGIVKSADRSKAGPTAPPHGLFLWKVAYRETPE